MSQEYMQQLYISKEPSTLCPWPKGVNLWKYVQDEKYRRDHKAEAEKRAKELENNGSRKRHRNPATR